MMTYDEAVQKYKETFYGGRKRGYSDAQYKFPLGIRYTGEVFIEVDIPVEYLQHRLRKPELVDLYAQNISALPAVWLSVGVRMKNNDVCLYHDRKIRILDGFHRIAAHKKAGVECIKAIVPQKDYEILKTHKVINYELCSKN